MWKVSINTQLSFIKWKVGFVTEKVSNSFIKWNVSFAEGKVFNICRNAEAQRQVIV